MDLKKNGNFCEIRAFLFNFSILCMNIYGKIESMACGASTIPNHSLDARI
jgi:hypothetical protein